MSNQFHYLSSFWLVFFPVVCLSARFQFRAVRERESLKVLEKESFSTKLAFNGRKSVCKVQESGELPASYYGRFALKFFVGTAASSSKSALFLQQKIISLETCLAFLELVKLARFVL